MSCLIRCKMHGSGPACIWSCPIMLHAVTTKCLSHACLLTLQFFPTPTSVTSYLHLTFPLFTAEVSRGRWNEKGRTVIPIFLLHLETRERMTARWDHLRGSAEAADLDLQHLSYSSLGIYTHESCLFSYDSTESSPTVARISWFSPHLAFSKKNTLDEFQA